MVRSIWTFIIVIILALMLLSGCNSNLEKEIEASTEQTKTQLEITDEQTQVPIEIKSFMTRPIIKVLSFPSITVYEIEVAPYEEYVKIPYYKDNFVMEIHFNNPLLTPKDIEKQIELFPSDLNYEVNVYEDWRVDIRINDIKENEQYSVKLKKNIENAKGELLENEINLTIKPVKFTEATFKVIGEEEVLLYEGASYHPEVSNGEPQLNDEPKKIEIAFTNEVNKDSVEQAIYNDITEKDAIYTLEWLDDKTLLMNITSFQRIGFFEIPTMSGLDKNDFIIYNNFYFSVDRRNDLYSYDIENDAINLVKTYDNKRYTANFNSYFNNYLLLADNYNEYIYDRAANNVTMIDTELSLPRYLGMGFWTSEIKWIDEDTIIYYKEDIDYIVTYSLKDKILKPILSLSNKDLINGRFFHLVPSPDSQKFAFATFSYVGEQDCNFNIYVYSFDGEKIYENDQIEYLSGGYVMGGEYFNLDLDWLNNDELIYEAGTKDNNEPKINIVKTNINTNKTEVLVEKGIKPITYPQYGAVVTKKYDSDYNFGGEYKYTLFMDEEKVNFYEDGRYQLIIGDETINFQKYFIYNLFLIDNNRIAYNRTRTVKEENHSEYQVADLIIYNFRTDEEEVVIGQGEIVGTSPDGKIIYFMTNQKFLLPVT